MNTRRLDTLDSVRGLAMVWMTVFHFCFDLNNAGVIQQNFLQDPVWTWQRTAILSLFLCCAGAGQAIATRFIERMVIHRLRFGQSRKPAERDG